MWVNLTPRDLRESSSKVLRSSKPIFHLSPTHASKSFEIQKAIKLHLPSWLGTASQISLQSPFSFAPVHVWHRSYDIKCGFFFKSSWLDPRWQAQLHGSTPFFRFENPAINNLTTQKTVIGSDWLKMLLHTAQKHLITYATMHYWNQSDFLANIIWYQSELQRCASKIVTKT